MRTSTDLRGCSVVVVYYFMYVQHFGDSEFCYPYRKTSRPIAIVGHVLFHSTCCRYK
jgi:hypothetical protein